MVATEADGRALPRFLTVEEVADRLAVSTKSIRRSISRGDLQVHRIGRQLRISEEDFCAYVSSRRSY